MTPEIAPWEALWRWMFILGCSSFVLLLVYALLTGARDIVEMFKGLASGEDEDLE
jgi:hypothetical protein